MANDNFEDSQARSRGEQPPSLARTTDLARPHPQTNPRNDGSPFGVQRVGANSNRGPLDGESEIDSGTAWGAAWAALLRDIDACGRTGAYGVDAELAARRAALIEQMCNVTPSNDSEYRPSPRRTGVPGADD